MTAINFTNTENLPEALQISVSNALNAWYQRVSELGLIVPEDDKFKASLAKVWCSSQFISDSCTRKPQILIDLITTGDLSAPITIHWP
jgi:[glutamine synthetase] adenylyltransferase / [glutamine synthetase]-adenylyl-L-tyrosine phosphorylase